MSTAQLIWAGLIGAQAIVVSPFVIHLIRNHTMAISFAALQAAAAELSTNATALTTQAAASDDASNQATLDAVTQTITAANAELAALIVPPAAPAE